MNRIQLLLRAKVIIETQLNNYIISTEFNEDASNLKITLLGGITLYVRYNDHHEYSYTIQFSLNKFDRIRFDNFDKTWGVETDPHHVHLRFEKNAHKSPMKGILEADLQVFIYEIKKSLNYER